VAKVRLDQLLVARELAPSRARALGVVLAGEVFVEGLRVDKAGVLVEDDAAVEVRGPA
jgi:23S rRNA (cytidine1920-2'-O)/16S rRNA (cytidine1409-2'-O)-methyltransferase